MAQPTRKKRYTALLLSVTAVTIIACSDKQKNTDSIASSASTAIDGNNPHKAPTVDSLVSGLRARLELNPNDKDGWILLAKSYAFLNDPYHLNEALKKARQLGYDGPDFTLALHQKSNAPNTPQSPALPKNHPPITSGLSHWQNDSLHDAMNSLINKKQNRPREKSSDEKTE